MSTEVALHGKYTREQLLAMSGQLLSGNKDFLSSIFINKSPEFINRDTEEVFDVPVGVFTLDHKEHGRVYSKRQSKKKDEKQFPVLFRPYFKGYRYEAYDKATDANAGRSIIASSFFGTEWISDNGYMKAGKDSNASYASGVRCKILVYGTISFSGTNHKGEEVEIKDYPAFIKLGGQSFLEYDEIFKDLSKAGKLSFQYDLKLTAKHLGDGKYVSEIVWDNLTEEHPITDDTIKTLENFIQYIEVENKRIENKWKRITDKSAKPGEVKDHIVEDVNSDLGADLVEDEVVDD